MSSPTPHRFDDPIWPIRDVLGWILDRDPLKFGRLFTDEDTKSALVGTIRRPRTERDRQVLTTVLHALQCGELVTYNEADAVSRDFWTDKTPGYIQRLHSLPAPARRCAGPLARSADTNLAGTGPNQAASGRRSCAGHQQHAEREQGAQLAKVEGRARGEAIRGRCALVQYRSPKTPTESAHLDGRKPIS